ncbi:MAG: hypothetical protein KGJ73_07525, partial [Rhodospirillales bacterium]|nr:hypothetical protein [Rhodospirillales bacterium]
MRKHTGKTTTQRDRRDESIPTAPVVASATTAEPSAEPTAAVVVPATSEPAAEPAALETEALAKRQAFIEAL